MLHAVVLAAIIAPAVITNSGSTNFSGYTVVVARDGAMRVQNGATVATKRIDRKLAAKLYADLSATGSLDALPAAMCMKSASFGTSTHIAYDGETSPDLQCARDPRTRRLADDVNAILTAVDVHPVARRGLIRVPQRLVVPNVMPTTPPVPAPAASPQ